MSYLKYKATQLFTGETLLNEDWVLIAKKNGEIVDIVSSDEAGPDVNIYNGIIMPGLINCHCHLELSHLKKNINEGSGMVDFILQILQKRGSTQEIIEEAIVNADSEMKNNGIVAVGDISNTTNTIPLKLKSSIYYHNFIEVSGFVPTKATERFEDGLKVFNVFAEHFPHQTSMVPHAPYSVSPLLFNKIKTFSKDKILSIHNQESEDENELFEHKKGDFLRLYKALNIDLQFFKPTGKSSLLSVAAYLKDNQTILVHNGYLKEDDLIKIKNLYDINENQFWLCLCILANKFIGNSTPNCSIIKNNINNIVIGTDSLASNKSLNLLDEITLLKQHFPLIETVDLLKAITINGAKALKIEDKFGKFKKGMRPGIIFIENLYNSNKIIVLSY